MTAVTLRRQGLQDDRWERIKDDLPGRVGHVGVTVRDNRLLTDRVLHRYRCGSARRDFPEYPGDFRKVHTRFSRLSKSRVWRCLSGRLAQEAADNEYASMDSTIVRAHQHSAEARKEEPDRQAIGRSRSGLSTGRVGDRRQGLRRPGAGHRALSQAGQIGVIPSRSTNKQPCARDRHLYQARHPIENFFTKFKPYRAIAARCDKTARNFLDAIHLAAAAIWLD